MILQMKNKYTFSKREVGCVIIGAVCLLPMIAYFL